ncbi:hypothetical protein Dsin_032324 [Dipteronia sinensis]|uniref:MULE transposase domain-containing protein n=1 Tax=Dipteronia sinensis TaxID=43782 RepID=A0AAD9ZNK0_9ROSI|nr:hypothetical protein Dsin_032324 [Dipteronia sinensis]
MLCFELLDDRHMGFIEFELILVPNAIQFPEDDQIGMFCFNEPVEENNVKPVQENNVEPVQENYDEPVETNNEEDNVVLVEENSEEENVGGDTVNDGSDKSSVDNQYEVGEESEDDSDVSLVDENGDKDYGNKDHCQPDGDETALVVSFYEETTLKRIARYYKVTFMIMSVRGSHSMCPWVIENKEATSRSRWVSFVRKFGEVLLSATTLDRDNCIISIAICICKSENSESWIWFLRQLRDSLGWDDSRRICFISDRQKECLKALAKEWPNAYIRYCFRHIIANFISTFKNHKINWKLWNMAVATNRASFKQALALVREESENAANWLMLQPIEK